MKRRFSARGLVAALALMTGLAPVCRPDTYVVYVAPRDSPASAVAKSKADGATVFAERRLHRALTKAAELLQSGPHTVNVLVAPGAYPGKIRAGVWVLPPINNPQGSLRLIGGFNDDFTGRQPFRRLSRLVTVEGRDGALLQISRKSALKQLVISGFVFDAAPSNKYDAKTNSLLKAQSRSYPLISFSQLKTSHLVVDSNIFLNGAHGAFDPYIAPLSPDTVVDISNNFFMNNIKTMTPAATAARGLIVKQIHLLHNSFLLSWPFNPDPTSSNVSAIELYHKDGCQQLTIESNIFAFNPGGAMQHDWPEDRMPALAIRNNLFYMNSALFKDGNAENGVFAGKFGTNPKYLLLDIETVEDDLDYDVEGNVSLDPKITIAMADLKAADSYSVERKDTVMNDIRRLFGLNQDGGTVAIANFAPALVFSTHALPLPAEQQAKAFGVQPNQLWKP